MKLPWLKILNALGYQTVWFLTLFSASKGHFWFGFLASLVFSGLMLCFGGNAKKDCQIVLIGLILGVSIDSAFAASGWIEYAQAWPSINIAPLWIIALWLSFSFTLNHSMSFLRKNYVAATAFGFIGGPLAYWCADRVFDVIGYGTSTGLVMLALGVCWGLVIPAIFYIDKRVSMQDQSQKAAA